MQMYHSDQKFRILTNPNKSNSNSGSIFMSQKRISMNKDAPAFKPADLAYERNKELTPNVSLMESLDAISGEVLEEATAEIY